MLPFAPEKRQRWFVRIAKEYTASGKSLSTVKDLLFIGGLLYAFFYAWAGNSHTTFHFAEATHDLVKLNVTAEGPKLKPAYLRSARMSFESLRIEPVRLRSAGDDVTHTSMVVSPGQPAVVVFTIGGLRAQCRRYPMTGKPDRFTKEELLTQIAKGKITVTMEVQESNDNDLHLHVLTLTVPATMLYEFIKSNLPDDIPETSC